MSFACVLCRLFAFLMLFLKSSLSILISWTLLYIWFPNVFSLSLVFLLIFSIRSLDSSQFGFSLLCSSVQSLSHVQLFMTPWTAARQASLSITNSWSLPKLMCIEPVMPSNHLILCCPLSCPQSFPASRSFQMSQVFTSGGQSSGVSASASVLPMNTQDWFPLEWTG